MQHGQDKMATHNGIWAQMETVTPDMADKFLIAARELERADK